MNLIAKMGEADTSGPGVIIIAWCYQRLRQKSAETHLEFQFKSYHVLFFIWLCLICFDNVVIDWV